MAALQMLRQGREAGTVTCYSLLGFRGLIPERDVAVISISDDDQTQVELSGWGAALRCRFTDVEFDEAYLKVWGWSAAGQAGVITPTIARTIAAYVVSDEVRRCKAVVVHCHAGESRSTAVGTYIAEQLDYRLVTTRPRCNPNKTVLLLLRDPEALGSDQPVKKSVEGRGLSVWLKGLFSG